MLLNKSQYSSDHDINFLPERPVGWSSACFDSTVNYYLDYNNTSIDVLTEEEDSETKKEKA